MNLKWKVENSGLATICFIFYSVIYLSNSSSAQTWLMNYDSGEHEEVFSMQKVSTGGYVLAGSISLNLAGRFPWILRVNSQGDVLWQKAYGQVNTFNTVLVSISETLDTGFVAAGIENCGFGCLDDVEVYKINSAGDLQWRTKLGGSRQDIATSVQQTSDGGYLVGGATASSGTGNWEIWIIKLTSAGNVEWQKTYGASVDDYIYEAKVTSDGGFVIVGQIGTGQGGAWVIKADQLGNVLWQKEYTSTDTGPLSNGLAIDQTSDNGFIVVGQSLVVIKINSSGDVEWSRATTDFDARPISVRQTTDGGYVITGTTFVNGDATTASFIVKLASNGDRTWSKVYQSSSNDEDPTAEQTLDGGFIVAGHSGDGVVGVDPWLLKLDQNGEINQPCDFLFDYQPAFSTLSPNVSNTNVVPVISNIGAVPLTDNVSNTSVVGTQQCGGGTCLSPTIILQPPNPVILPGLTATLTVVAEGTPELEYQWFVGQSGDISNPIPGETDDHYETPPLSVAASYWVRIKNSCGQVDSITANVTISTECPLPAITRQPRSTCVEPGWVTTLSIEVDGLETFAYQWFQGSSYDNSSPIPEANFAAYAVPPQTQNTSFWVQVSNRCGVTKSRLARVIVATEEKPCCITSRISGPSNQPVKYGKKANLCVFAKNCSFSYQWYRGQTGDRSNPVGGNNQEFKTDNVTSNEKYWVEVSNGRETYDSPTAHVVVIPDPGPADDETKLLPDEDDPSPLGNRIPLILIHGNHGNQWPHASKIRKVFGTDKICEPYRDYWKHFLNYVETHPSLPDHYKIYRFHYQSDHENNDVWQIARSFRNHLDAMGEADPNFRDKPLVFVAHSMGGLVARTYMQEHSHDCTAGTYCGDKGGERTQLLITLATPHHGSPLANKDPRAPGNDYCAIDTSCMEGVQTWNDMVSCSDFLAWGSGGCPICSCYPKLPNRADLRFDNFDHMWDGNSDYAGDELNDLLNRINQDFSYDTKIIAYYGHIGSDKEVLRDGQMNAFQLGQNLLELSEARVEKYALRALGVLLERITMSDFDDPISLLKNDGFVTIGSSAFNGHAVRQVECKNRPENRNLGFDHLDMKDGGRSKICQNDLQIFTSVYADLLAAAAPDFDLTQLDFLAEDDFYTEAFEHNNTSDWIFKKGSWFVDDEGHLVGVSDRKTDAISDYWGCSNCTIEADLQIENLGGRVSLLAWYQGKSDNVEIRLMEDKQKILLKHKSGGRTAAKGSAPLRIVPEVDYHLKAVYDASTSSFKVFVDGSLILDVPTRAVPSGTVGFRIKSTTGQPVSARFAEILVY